MPAITVNVLYGVSPYDDAGYGPGIKLLLIAIAGCWISFLLMVAPAKRIAPFSTCDANAPPAYILHGFVIKLLATTQLFAFGQAIGLSLAFAISFVIVLGLGCKPVAAAFNLFCTGEWVERLIKS